MKNDDFYNFLLSAFQCMVAHLEKGGSAYVFHADTEGLNFRRAFVDAGFHLAGCCIWVKDSLVLCRSDYQWKHEPVLYGFMQNGKHKWYSDRKQTTIWNFDKPKRNANHPTSKPLDLLAYPIGNSTQENAVVIDTFGGSGSTLMACEQMNRIPEEKLYDACCEVLGISEFDEGIFQSAIQQIVVQLSERERSFHSTVFLVLSLKINLIRLGAGIIDMRKNAGERSKKWHEQSP